MKKFFTLPKLIIFLLILVIAYLGLWLVLRSTVASGISDYIAELESEGYRVEHGGISITGFPVAIDARSPNLKVRTTPNTQAASEANWSVDMDEFDLFSSTLTPFSWALRHRGELGVDMRINNGPRYMFDISPANIDADVSYNLSGKLKSLHTDISRTKINPLIGAEPPILGLTGIRADLNVRDDRGQLDILGKDIVVSQQALGVAYNVLGQNIARFSMKAEIENWQVLETEGLENWVQSPAKIRSEDWQLLWGSADIVGSFELEFKNTYPEGVIRFRVKNMSALMDKLSAANLVDSLITDQINGFMAGVDTDAEGRKSIEITIRDGVVKYGFFTLYRF